MKSISEIISALKELQGEGFFRSVRVKFNAPSLYVTVEVDGEIPNDYESQILQLDSILRSKPGFGEINLSEVSSRLPVLFEMHGACDRDEDSSVSEISWVSAFLGEKLVSAEFPPGESEQKFVHFYGFKGGQGRSTVLALLAQTLANDGYKILVVDADVEAPSLDHVFSATASGYSQTLMGLCGWSDRVEPIGGVYVGKSGGRIDIIPCRPRAAGADIDFALMVAVAPLDANIYRMAGAKLRNYLDTVKEYDMVFVDHRTGVATSVLPLMEVLPGSAAIFARPDPNIATIPTELRNVVSAILQLTFPAGTSSFVGFSLDPNKRSGSNYSESEVRIKSQLIEMLAENAGADGDLVFSSDLGIGWVDWFLDRALLGTGLPDVDKLQSDNISAIRTLRDYLGLPFDRAESVKKREGVSGIIASVSGAKDNGAFIHIPGVESLLISGSPYTYILGRKGTGKTRLLKEMAKRNLGRPILVAADETETIGLQSQSIESDEWLLRCNYDPNVFWWSLLHLAIDNPKGLSMSELVAEKISENVDPKSLSVRTVLKGKILNTSSVHAFLIDGLETLVPADKIKAFVGALFDVMAAIQNDPAMATKLVLRSFVREDLASDVAQNIEQQIEGRHVRLKWDVSAILNFAISRIPTLSWVRNKYGEVCDEIEDRWADIERSALSEIEATDLMLKIFPARLRRNNLSTVTFLKLYFSDAGGDDNNKSTFYPRLYLTFLQKLDILASQSASPVSDDGKLDSALLNQAYDEASGDFINETKQELTHLLSLQYEEEGSKETDTEKVSKFVSAFDGLSTPFDVEMRIVDLYDRTKFTQKSIRESLQRMKAIRMFEDRPGYAGWWRVGQLYKRGLRMKYVRNSN